MGLSLEEGRSSMGLQDFKALGVWNMVNDDTPEIVSGLSLKKLTNPRVAEALAMLAFKANKEGFGHSNSLAHKYESWDGPPQWFFFRRGSNARVIFLPKTGETHYFKSMEEMDVWFEKGKREEKML